MSDNKNNNKPRLVVVQNPDEKTNKKQDNIKKTSQTKSAVKKKQASKSAAKKTASVKPVEKKTVNTKTAVKKAEKPKNNRKINIKLIIGIMLAAILVVAIVYFVKTKKISLISDNDNLYSTEFGVNSKADFYVLNKNIFYCTKDVATLLDKKGEQVWSDTLSMVSPSMLADGNFVGVADIKNKVLNVYSETGKVYSLETDGNITSFAINPLGATAVICRNSTDNDYSVSVYNPQGQKMFMGTYISKDGIPMTIDISDDSSKVAVGFLKINGIDISSNILFYSTDKVIAQKIENSDAMFSAVNCDEEMVGKIKFLDDDSCIIATDKSLINIGGTNVAAYEQNWKNVFTNYVTAIDIIDSDYVAVAYGDQLEASEESIEKNSIYWYNAKNGNVKGSTSMQFPVSKLSSGFGISIAELEDNTFVALQPDGDELWSYKGIQSINNILFYRDTKTIAVVSAAKMTLTEVKNGAENTEIETEAQTKAAKEDEEQTKAAQETEQQTEKAQETTTAKQNS